MPLDQGHGQNDVKMKDSDGAIGLTGNKKHWKDGWFMSGTGNVADKVGGIIFPNGFWGWQQKPRRRVCNTTDFRKRNLAITAMSNPLTSESSESMTLDSHSRTGGTAVWTICERRVSRAVVSIHQHLQEAHYKSKISPNMWLQSFHLSEVGFVVGTWTCSLCMKTIRGLSP